MNIDNLRTVCLALGPYRNLTTLTASLLFLHPRCQVLNHGSDHILSNPGINFLYEYSDSKFDAFVEHAIQLSAEGKRGRHGGSITMSHAFDDKGISETYSQRFHGKKIKGNIECLFWKESLRVTRFIKQYNVDLDDLFQKNERLRFIMPVRYPVDCALSNIKSGHALALTQSTELPSYTEVLTAILLELSWFFKLQKKHPDRFFCFFENTFNSETIHQLAHFLEIEPEKRWVDDVISNYNIRHPYQYGEGMISIYKKLVNSYFDPHPAIRHKLLSFTAQHSK
jgi:hypothetical protein